MKATLFLVLPLLVGSADTTCETETAALTSNANLQSAYLDFYSQLTDNIPNDILSFCNLFTISCKVNLDKYADNVVSNCTTQGGKIVDQGAEVQCTGKLSGIPIPGGVTIDVQNIPVCVGASCTNDTALLAKDATVIQDMLQEVEQQIESSLQDGKCNITLLGESAGVSKSAFGGVIITSLFVVASWILS